MSEDYSGMQPSFEAPAPSQSAREKSRSNRASRGSRVMQQSQQQPQNAYQTSAAQQQNTRFQTQSQQQQQQQPQSYAAMGIQTVQLGGSVANQQQPQPMQIATLNEQSSSGMNADQISASITAAAVQNLVTVQHNFAAQPGNPSSLQAQHPAIRPLPTAAPMSSKPYKIVQPQQQCYKFPNLVENLSAQQCKFNAGSLKVIQPSKQESRLDRRHCGHN